MQVWRGPQSQVEHTLPVRLPTPTPIRQLVEDFLEINILVLITLYFLLGNKW